MLKEKEKKLELISLVYCSIALLIIFLSHLFSIKILMISGIVIACTGIVILPYICKITILLSFLPWMEVLKLSPSSPTLYHMLYFSFLMFIVLKEKKIKIKSLLMILIFSIYIFFNRFIRGNLIELGFAAYIMSIIFLDLLMLNYEKYCNKILCINSLYLGIISSFLAEKVFRNINHMTIYLSSDTYTNSIDAIRYAGLFNDSNFISVLILMTLCFSFNIFKYEKLNKRRKRIMFFNLTIVSLFGFLTSSKMFFVGISIILLSIVLKSILKVRIKTIFLLFLILILVGYIFFKLGILDGILFRLNDLKVNNNDFSNGRIDILNQYMNFFYNNVYELFFGIGMYDRIYLNDISTHNTFVSLIYQMGIIGTIFIYIPVLFNIIKNIKELSVKNDPVIIIIFIICCASLDILMNEALPLYIIIIIMCLARKGHASREEKNYEGISNCTSL